MLSESGLKTPIHAHFWGVLGVKWGKGNILLILSLWNAISRERHLKNRPHKNRCYGLGSECDQKSGSQIKKTTNHARVILHLFAQTKAITLNVVMRGDIIDVITHANFYIN